MVGNAAQHRMTDIGAAAILDIATDRIAAARITDQRDPRAAPVRRFNSLTASASSRRWSSVEERSACSTWSSVRANGSVKLIANIRSRGTPFDSILHIVVIQSAAWRHCHTDRPARATPRRSSESTAATRSFWNLPLLFSTLAVL
jgi:hypothetical protein